MTPGRVVDVLSTLAREPDGRGDGELVGEFVARRTEAAFAELLRRHGPTVFGVCRRMLGHTQDAEDAFQAVFLVLARRADRVRPPGQVGNWLYGVAVRTALKSRTAAARRQQRQLASARSEAVEDAPDGRDLRGVLDEELARLAPKYRSVIVLCDLNGQSRSAAAQHLGWPEGTVAARLAKARRLLGTRLARRGVTLAAGGLTISLGADVTAAVPLALAADTLAHATGVAAVPPTIETLAETVMRTMTWAKFRLPAVLLLAATLTAAAVFAAGPKAKPPTPPNPPGRPAEVKPMTWTLRSTLDQDGWLAGSVAYSPDGNLLVVGGTDNHVQAYDAAKLTPAWDYQEPGGSAAALAFSTDGKQLAATFRDGVVFLDPATGKKSNVIEEKESWPAVVAFFPEVELPGDNTPKLRSHKLMFGGANGYTAMTWIDIAKPSSASLSIGPVKKTGYAPPMPLAVDPKGQRAVCLGPIDRDTGKNVLWAWSAGSGAANKLLDGHTATVTAAAWSADGNTIITGDASGLVIRWDGQTFKELSRVQFSGQIAAVAVTADGAELAAAVAAPIANREAYNEEVYVWPAASPPAKPVPLVQKAAGAPFSGQAGLAFAPDGKALAAGFCNFDHLSKLGELLGHIRVWQLKPAE
ncbi:MAG: sigma-70 family RNA polymerase sigma factor [Gemmataceae bacterium]